MYALHAYEPCGRRIGRVHRSDAESWEDVVLLVDDSEAQNANEWVELEDDLWRWGLLYIGTDAAIQQHAERAGWEQFCYCH